MTNVVYDILTRYAPLDRKRTPSGWLSFNGVCCVHNGELRPDTRKRAGIRLTPENVCIYSCFNCKYKAIWAPGNQLGSKMKDLMSWLGIQQEDLRKVEFKIWQLREIRKAESPEAPKEWTKLEFAESELPRGSKPITDWLEQGLQDQNFLDVISYLAGRGDDILMGYDYYWTPDKEHDMNRRIIIPFRWQGKIVGYTARAIFATRYRYYTDVQQGYFFNSEVANTNWRYLFINEGPFDGIASNGLAMLGDKISDEQIRWINQTGKIPIIVPDREKQGGALVDVALRENWHVTFPRWDKDVKDAAHASQVYGKLYTIWSLIDARTNNRLQINIERQRLK